MIIQFNIDDNDKFWRIITKINSFKIKKTTIMLINGGFL